MSTNLVFVNMIEFKGQVSL